MRTDERLPVREHQPVGTRLEGVTKRLNGEAVTHQALLDGHVYDELRRIVAAQLKHERGGMTGRGTDLNLTKVCHDVWIKLKGTPHWESRRHYFGSAARATRQVLVDAAKKARRRETASLDDLAVGGGDGIAERLTPRDARRILVIDEVASVADNADPRVGHVLLLRVFGGWDTRKIAELLGVSREAVQRDLRSVRPELRRRLGDLYPGWIEGD